MLCFVPIPATIKFEHTSWRSMVPPPSVSNRSKISFNWASWICCRSEGSLKISLDWLCKIQWWKASVFRNTLFYSVKTHQTSTYLNLHKSELHVPEPLRARLLYGLKASLQTVLVADWASSQECEPHFDRRDSSRRWSAYVLFRKRQITDPELQEIMMS